MKFRGEIISFDRKKDRGVISYRRGTKLIEFSRADVINFKVLEVKEGLTVVFNVVEISKGIVIAKNISLHSITDPFKNYENRFKENTKTFKNTREIIDFYSQNWEQIEEIIEDKEASIASDHSVDIEKISIDEEISNPNLTALALINRKIKLVSLTEDGRYRFLDEAESYHNIIYPSFFEEISSQLAIEEFEDLINSSKAKENDFQKFFEDNSDFILNDDYKQAHPHIVLSKENEENLIPDFILEPIDQSSFCDLLELKLPSTEIFVLKKNRARYSAAVFEAAAQLREYGKYFDSEANLNRFQQNYPHLRVYKPRMFVIIGRQNNESSMLKREIQSEFPQLFLKTYDELLARMKWKKQRLENKNRLF